MSQASRRADATAELLTERQQHWIAVLCSALLHALFVLLAMWSSRIAVTPPQGADADAGGRMAVQFIGVAPPPPGPAMSSRPPATPPPSSPVQSTPVPRAENPVPPATPDEPAQGQTQASSATPASPAPAWRRSHAWGQPPGLLPEETSPVNAGLARSPTTRRGRSDSTVAGEPSLEVGGYQVYYDLRSEARLRGWREQGMTELFLPLPGTRRYMVCPLETMLRRESGPCRLLEPDAPELQAIGDAREGIDMQQVFRQGELVWRGPGPYR